MRYTTVNDIDKANAYFVNKLVQLRACCKSMRALSMKCGIKEVTLYELKKEPSKVRLSHLRKLKPQFDHFHIPIDFNEVIG